MKSIGIVRQVDPLGRVVLPKELRKTLDINEKDPLEIFTDKDRIILQKYNPRTPCMITGEISEDNKVFANGKLVLSPKGIEILMNELEKKLAHV